MAKYVFQYSKEDLKAPGNQKWTDIAMEFANQLQMNIKHKFGLFSYAFSEEDGAEITDGCEGMGKDWFNFRFHIFMGQAIYIDCINVPYEWRGKGIGFYLIEQIKAFAKENGLAYVFLGSYEPSNPFWERCGFKKINDYPDFVVGIDGTAK